MENMNENQKRMTAMLAAKTSRTDNLIENALKLWEPVLQILKDAAALGWFETIEVTKGNQPSSLRIYIKDNKPQGHFVQASYDLDISPVLKLYKLSRPFSAHGFHAVSCKCTSWDIKPIAEAMLHEMVSLASPELDYARNLLPLLKPAVAGEDQFTVTI